MSAHTKPARQSFTAGPMTFNAVGLGYNEPTIKAWIVPADGGRWTLSRGDETAVDQNGNTILFDRPQDAASFAVFLWKDLIK